jgi:CheY-specific phosphatase CheX
VPADHPSDAKPATGAPSALIEAFSAATATAFEELTRTPLVPGEPYLSRSGPAAGWMAAEIRLRRAAEGHLVLAFPPPVLETLAGRYLADGPAVTPELLDDTAGEFANVIAGQAKTMLKGTPYHFHISTPRVGPAVPSDGAEFLVLPFDTDVGRFTVSVSIAPCQE